MMIKGFKQRIEKNLRWFLDYEFITTVGDSFFMRIGFVVVYFTCINWGNLLSLLTHELLRLKTHRESYMKTAITLIIFGALCLLSSVWVGTYLMINIPEYQFASAITGLFMFGAGFACIAVGAGLVHDTYQNRGNIK